MITEYTTYFFAWKWLALILFVVALRTTDISFPALVFISTSIYLLITHVGFIEYENRDIYECIETKTLSSCGCIDKDDRCYLRAFNSDPEWLRYRNSKCNSTKTNSPISSARLLRSYGDNATIKEMITQFSCSTGAKDEPVVNTGWTPINVDSISDNGQEYMSSLSGFQGVFWYGFAGMMFLVGLKMVYSFT